MSVPKINIMELEYFGTDLNRVGHDFRVIHKDGMSSSSMLLKEKFKSLPFNPEELPISGKRGDWEFHEKEGYSILAVCGSPADNRPGSKCVFFIKKEMNMDDFVHFMLSYPITGEILRKLYYIDEETTDYRFMLLVKMWADKEIELNPELKTELNQYHETSRKFLDRILIGK